MPPTNKSIMIVGCVFLSVGAGCYSGAVDAIYDHGGVTVQEGLFRPSTRIIFRAERQRLDDEQFRELFPAILRLRPYALGLIDMPITDESMKLVRRLDTLMSLYVDGTRVSAQGLRTLKGMPRLNQVTVSANEFSAEDVAHLAGDLGVEIIRRQKLGGEWTEEAQSPP